MRHECELWAPYTQGKIGIGQRSDRHGLHRPTDSCTTHKHTGKAPPLDLNREGPLDSPCLEKPPDGLLLRFVGAAEACPDLSKLLSA
ncbi:MAG: hypothetical protein AAAC48_17470 [Phyllobacterium sp.]|jgi:hypothetical protein|uniref:hypothetical protein n=1 Tax=Phyllobacterium sp. TaxID=1871046 RepID=UPI0030F1A8B8